MRSVVMAVSLMGPLVAAQENARSDAAILADAQAAFDRGVEKKTLLLESRRNFAAAADHYLELHRRGARSPGLYLSLGNALALADRWPEALWAYHMGLQLDPNDKMLREQLATVRTKVIFPASGQGRPEPDSWPAWLPRPRLHELFWISLFLYSATCVLGTTAWLTDSPRLKLVALAAFVLAGLAIFGLWHAIIEQKTQRDAPLVVVAENTPLYRGNGTSYAVQTSLPALPRGMEVRQIHRRGDWLQVRLTTGEVGWIPARAALVVAIEQ